MSSKLYTQQKIIEWSNKIHFNKYIYTKSIYIGMLTKFEIICPKHGSFFQTPAHHIHRKHGCPKCKGEANAERCSKGTEECIRQARQTHGDTYIYDNILYKNDREKIEIICRVHGSFFQSPGNHIKRSRGCSKCKGGVKLTQEEFLIKANKIHNNFYIYVLSKYINSQTKIIITCPIHGNFEQIPNVHLSGGGCLECSMKELSERFAMGIEEFLIKANKIHNNFYGYLLTKYVNNNTKIIITCPVHGNFEQTPAIHLRGCGCSQCNRGSRSPISQRWLNDINIKEEFREYRILNYIVDGFNPETNTIFEFLGDYYHGNPKIYPNPNGINTKVGRSFGELYDYTITRHTKLIEAGYKIVYIWEDTYKRLNPDILLFNI